MAPFSFFTFVGSQFKTLPAVETQDLTGRTVIVSGSNVGLGLEAARHFARMSPAKLILAVRNVKKGEAAAEDIVRSTNCSTIEVWQVDQTSFQSVKAFCARAEKELDRLDVLLLNAGVARDFWEETEDGLETTIQTNGVTTTWMALRLLPLMKKTASSHAASGFKPHLTLTGSEVHFWAKFKGHDSEKPLAHLNDKSKFDASDRYNVSKLLNIYMAREIGKLAGSAVNVDVVNPGLCHSELSRDSGYFLTVLKFFLARSTEVGSRNLVWACLNDTPSGAYVSDCAVHEESDFALSAAGRTAQTKVWQEMLEIIRKQDPELQA